MVLGPERWITSGYKGAARLSPKRSDLGQPNFNQTNSGEYTPRKHFSSETAFSKIPIQELPTIFRCGEVSERFCKTNLDFPNSLRKRPSSEISWKTSYMRDFRNPIELRIRILWNSEFGMIFKKNLLRKYRIFIEFRIMKKSEFIWERRTVYD